MGNYLKKEINNKDTDKPISSYHICKKFGDIYIFWWPLCGNGEYCNDLDVAKVVFEKEKKDGPCRLMEYEATFKNNRFVGITGEGKIIAQSPIID